MALDALPELLNLLLGQGSYYDEAGDLQLLEADDCLKGRVKKWIEDVLNGGP